MSLIHFILSLIGQAWTTMKGITMLMPSGQYLSLWEILFEISVFVIVIGFAHMLFKKSGGIANWKTKE